MDCGQPQSVGLGLFPEEPWFNLMLMGTHFYIDSHQTREFNIRACSPLLLAAHQSHSLHNLIVLMEFWTDARVVLAAQAAAHKGR